MSATNIGKLVGISGTVVAKNARKLYIDDGTSEAVVYFKASVDFNIAEVDIGDKIEAVGIVKEYGDEYRIVPRDKQDLVVLEKAPLSIVKDFGAMDTMKDKNLRRIFLLIAACMIVVSITYLKLRKKFSC